MPIPIDLPWAAWYEDGVHTLEAPGPWRVDILGPKGAPEMVRERIAACLASPIESPALANLARQSRTACVVVDDVSRPTRVSDLLPAVLEQLEQGGIGASSLSIVVATGTHGGMSPRHIAWKLGHQIPSAYRVEVHDAGTSVVPTGIQYGKRELRINRTFMASDLRVGIGCVLPHSFAGYSGGAKLMLPGLADVDATARSHKFVQMGLRGGRDPNENRFRQEIERLARELRFQYTVCVVPNAGRDTAGVFAGDVVAAHRRACAFAADIYATPIYRAYDCLIINAYPKDMDLVQAESGMVALKSARSPVVTEDGILLITTAASDGVGEHGLFAPGGVSYTEPRPKRGLGKREIWLYSPNLDPAQAHQLYWQGYPFFSDRRAMMAALAERLRDTAAVGVLPCAPMQQIDDRRAGP